MARAKGFVHPSADPNIAPGGAKQLSANSADSKKYLWAGKIVHVDVETMCCSVTLDSGQGEFHDIPLPASGGGGPRSWAGIIPEPGAKVVLGWKKVGHRTHQPVIIEILTSGVYPAREFEPFASLSPEESEEALTQHPELEDDPRFNWYPIRLKLRKAYPGNFLASSSDGSDILLDRDVNLSNRAGNELKLRDSDQTFILQTRNEFISNAAGYYRRGLIKRNAFSFLQDLYPLNDLTSSIAPYDISPIDLFNQVIPTDSPAFEILNRFGLIDNEGKKRFDLHQGLVEYPYIVSSDGQRINYVVNGENTNGFNRWSFAYIEDRKELRHISNGIMPVTEEGDGFQIDLDREVFIEDVHGTVVGNDFSSDSGRLLYKRVLKMKLFPDPTVRVIQPGPTFEAVNPIRQDTFDSEALARLYRIQAPNNSNQFVFGVNKEGRVFAHIPASTSAEVPDDVGRSVDLNVVGLFKAVFGKDPNTGLSADLAFNGGIKADIGRGPDGSSINVTLRGPIKQKIIGDDYLGNTPAHEVSVGGSASYSASGSNFTYIRGNNIRVSGALDTTEADSIQLNSGAGGLKINNGGELGITVLGETTERFGKKKTSTYALGRDTTHLAGVDSTTMLAGSITRTVTAGAGITDSVGTGNYSLSVGTGNLLMSTVAGNIGVTCGSGSLSITASAGPISLNSSTVTSITSTSNVFTAGTTKIGGVPTGFSVAGAPGPGGPHYDYIVGIPILGIPTIAVG